MTIVNSENIRSIIFTLYNLLCIIDLELVSLLLSTIKL